ncbi:MAG: flagellin, partial [Lachnospiraceae bacterium]|nr:flagellin [Lachnospiraceae bacterium]
KGSGIWLEIDKMDTEELGIDKLDITTIEGAADANIRVKEALRKLSISRSKIGAQQNRLEHTVNNEENISEQVSAAESRIRDTDLSSEMIRYSNLSILLQMGQSMIAQADQRIEKILTVLQ